MTDKNIREAIIKVFEFTIFDNPRIITFENYPRNCDHHKATYFLDLVSGNALSFRIGSKQDGKLWSMEYFDDKNINKIMTDPNIIKITDISNYEFK